MAAGPSVSPAGCHLPTAAPQGGSNSQPPEILVGGLAPERALRALMTVGLTLVISVMIYALSRDLICV